MKKKYIIYLIALIVIAGGSYFFFWGSPDKETKYVFAEIQRGDVSNTITSTGTLEALKTIDVGTQVSGRIDQIFVDFNSNVKKGQLLAVLDTTSLALQVSDALSNLEKAKAQYNKATAQFDRDKSLFDKGFLSELDYINSKTTLESSLSDYHSSQTALQRSRTNLGYAYIYSPISGIIINRNVEEGQTVAASLSTPTLFQIAENLSNMQILASVDEGDIGQIKIGQDAEFTVQAYPDKKFTGKVTQIRLNSEVVQNVVNYTVVVNAENVKNQLLPGMTATIDFYVSQKNNALLVPNSALSFQPTEEMLTEFRNEMASRFPDSLRNRFNNSPNRNFGQGGMNFGNRGFGKNIGRVWYFDENGKLRLGMFMSGLSDGKKTEIASSRNLKEGMKVITGIDNPGEESTTSSRNILNGRGFGPPRR
jgi:HlyD family secretion protein